MAYPFIFNYILIIAFIGLIAGILFLRQGPPYYPSDDETTKNIVEVIQKLGKKKVIDLGSGDGKLLIALALSGIAADGIELNPQMYLRSLVNIRKAGVSSKAHVRLGNFWDADLSSYDTVVFYGIKHVMHKFEEKFMSELPENSLIITNFVSLPSSEPFLEEGRVKAYRVNKSSIRNN